jgi:hypothetical protein
VLLQSQNLILDRLEKPWTPWFGAFPKCAEHVRQLGGESPIHRLMGLARISHRLSAAAVYPGMSALRSFGLLDVLSSTPAGPWVAQAEKLPDAPCIHARLRRLAR